MSHFMIAVFSKEGQTIEELLAPYQENNMGDCPKEYLKFNCVEDEYRKDFEEDGTEMVRTPDGRLLSKWDEEFKIPGKIGHGCDTHKVPENYEIVEVKHKDRYPDFDTFIRDWAGYKQKDPETGKYGYWENPNSKWDWYQIGGRWSGLLKLKSNATSGKYGERSWTNKDKTISKNKVDSAKVKDIDFTIDREEYEKELRFWELIVEGDTPRDSEEEKTVKWRFYKPEYYLNRYDNKEQYAKLTAEFSAYAVITPDGVWHSKGDMGWFGVSSETHEVAKKWNESFKETFIDKADPEWTLTVVDCHI